MNEAQIQNSIISEMTFAPCDQRQEDENWRYGGGAIPMVTGWMIRLRSETGIEAYGYSQSIGISSDVPGGARAVIEALVPVIVGQPALLIGRILKAMDHNVHGHLHAKSGIDMALHDLCARILGVPLSALFGGAMVQKLDNTRIVPICDPQECAEKSLALVQQGYRNLKIKLDGNATKDIARIRQVRARVGETTRICVDPNQSYDCKGALMTLRQISAFGVDLAEQPVPARDLSGLKLLRDSLDMYIEADESVQCLDDVLTIIRANAADCINFKVSRMGGLRNTIAAARLCEVAGIGYRIGAAFGPRIYTAQIAHMAACFPDHFYPHELAEFEHLLDDPSVGLPINEGWLTVPEGPGCGISMKAVNK